MAQKDNKKLILARRLNHLSNLFYFLSAALIFSYALFLIWGNDRSYTENKWYGWIVEQGHLLPLAAFGLIFIAVVISARIFKLEWPFQYSLEQNKKYDHFKMLKVALIVAGATAIVSELSLLVNGVIAFSITGALIFMFSPFLKIET
jgi:hypothetical protein